MSDVQIQTTGLGFTRFEFSPRRELKKQIRKKYGKLPQMQLGSLRLVEATGENGKLAEKKDLHDGITVECIYRSAPGNPQALGHRRESRGRGVFYRFF